MNAIEALKVCSEVLKNKAEELSIAEIGDSRPDKEYEKTLAHIQIVNNENITKHFGSAKDSFGVYFNKVFIGKIEREKGKAFWSGVPFNGDEPQKRACKSMMDCVISLIGDKFDDALRVAVLHTPEEVSKEESEENFEESKKNKVLKIEAPELVEIPPLEDIPKKKRGRKKKQGLSGVENANA